MKPFRHLALLLMCVLPVMSRAQFQCTTNPDYTLTIIGYDGTIPMDLVIPGKINGLTVTGIGDSSFTRNPFTTLSLPDSITSIGDWAFGYDSLTNVNLPRLLTNIGDWAFGHNSLTDLKLPDNVTNIGDWAFAYNFLTNVNFSKRLSTIGDGTFASNALLTVSLPADVASIGNNAFANNSFLTAIYCAGNAPFVKNQTFVTGASVTTVYYPPKMNGWWLTLGGSSTMLMPAPIKVTRVAGTALTLPFATLAKHWNPALIMLQNITLLTTNGVRLTTNDAVIVYPANSPNVADEITYTIANLEQFKTITNSGVIQVQVIPAPAR